MKKLLSILLLVGNVSANDVFPKDKQQHMIVGTVTYVSCMFVSLITKKNGIEWLNEDTCLIPVVVLAVGKEVYDSRGYGTPEVMDGLATVAVPLTISYTFKLKGL